MKVRRIRWAGHVAQMVEKKNAYRLLVGKPEGKRPLGILAWLFWGDVDWIGLAQDGDSSCKFGIEPSGSIKCWETIECPNNWESLEQCSLPRSC
jgi:hypothetical protein